MSMPAVLVVIACKVVFSPIEDPIQQANAGFTGYKPFEWATKHSQMECRRHEVQLFDSSAAMGADPIPFTPFQCMRASWQVRMDWDRGHSNTNWRVWRTACPVPIKDTSTDKVIAWKLPECPRINYKDRVAVHCEVDSMI